MGRQFWVVEFVAIRVDSSRIGLASPEIDSQNAAKGGVNWFRFDSNRTIRRESSCAQSNHNTGNQFAFG